MKLEHMVKLPNGDRALLELRLAVTPGKGKTTIYHQPAPDKFVTVSISGEIAPRGVRFGTNAGSFGQVIDALPVNDPIRNMWAVWHLNDMKAACTHQDSTSRLGDECVDGYRYGSRWLVKLPNPHAIARLMRLFNAPKDSVIISRDSVAIAVLPDYVAAMEHMHNITASSIEWACKYEGYAIASVWATDFVGI